MEFHSSLTRDFSLSTFYDSHLWSNVSFIFGSGFSINLHSEYLHFLYVKNSFLYKREQHLSSISVPYRRNKTFSYAHANLQKHTHKLFVILDIHSRDTSSVIHEKWAVLLKISHRCLSWKRLIFLEIIFPHVYLKMLTQLHGQCDYLFWCVGRLLL